MNTDGINSTNDITLSGESSAYFDTLNCGTFQGVDGDFFTGITSNIQTQINGISGSLSSTYVTLGTTQTITGAKQFTTNNPTCTTTATNANDLITKGRSDALYGALSTQNTWSQTNTFSRSILPRRQFGTGTDYQISPNAMANRQNSSVYNIGIGIATLAGDTQPAGYVYNTGANNVALGHFSLQNLDGGNNNVALGYQALRTTGQQRINGAGITPNRCVAIGSGAMQTNIYGNDNIAIGYNSLNNVNSGNYNIILGSNVGSGLSSVGSNIVIGYGAMQTAQDNGIVAIGESALGFAVGSCNRGVFIGEGSGLNNQNGNANTFIGGQSGTGNTTGSNNVCLGTFAGRLSTSSGNFMTCIGYDSQAIQDNEFVLGSETYAERADLTLPNKNRINCCQYTGNTNPFNISWRTNEFIVINSATTNTINLPQAVDPTALHVGACFTIVKNHLSTSNIIIVAFGTEKINWKGSLVSSISLDSWVLSISLVCIDNVAGDGVWSVKGYNDRVTLATDATKIQTLTDSSNVNYPVCFTTLSTGTGYNNVYGNSNMTYNPSTEILTTPNITLNNKYTLSAQYAPIGGSVPLSFNDPEYLILELFPIVTNVGLPSPTIAANIGTKFTIVNRGANLSTRKVGAATGEFIYDFNTQQTTNLFSLDNIGIAEFLCVGLASTSTTTWVVLNRDDNMVLTGNITQTVTGNKNFSNDITAANMVSSGQFKGKQFMFQSQNAHITANTTLTNPLFSYYTFSMRTAATMDITLPEITASNVGTMITFKRLGGSLQILRIVAVNTQPYFALGTNLGTTTATNNLITASQNCATIVAIISQEATGGAGLFTNAANSTTINVTTWTLGFITMGGRLNLNGNIRTVTAFGTGNGTTGTYTINTAIVAANTNQPYAQILSYGWSVTTVQ